MSLTPKRNDKISAKGSSIPIPGSHPTPNFNSINKTIAKDSTNKPQGVNGGCRSGSMSPPPVHSFIPTPRTGVQKPLSIDKTRTNKNGESVGGVQMKVPPPPEHSMIQKLRLFKEKRDGKSSAGKRNFNSSGFSSTKSERSDSSFSNDKKEWEWAEVEEEERGGESLKGPVKTSKAGRTSSSKTQGVEETRPSFLRKTKGVGVGGVRDPRLRFSGTGIPTPRNKNQMRTETKPTAAIKGNAKGPSTQTQTLNRRNREKTEKEEEEQDEALRNLRPMEPLPRNTSYNTPFFQQNNRRIIVTSPAESLLSFTTDQQDTPNYRKIPTGSLSDGDLLTNSDEFFRRTKILIDRKEESLEESSSVSSGSGGSEVNEIPTNLTSSELSIPYASLHRLGGERWKERGLDPRTHPHPYSHTDWFGWGREDGGKEIEARHMGVREEGKEVVNCLNGEGSSGSSDGENRRKGSSKSALSFGNLRRSIVIPERKDSSFLLSRGEERIPRTRTKVKISGGTQTPRDLAHTSPHASSHGGPERVEKSLSLTSPTASELAQTLRERILMGSGSLPKGTSTQDYGPILQALTTKTHPIYQNYHNYQNYRDFIWTRHSNPSPPIHRLRTDVREGESLESLSSLSSLSSFASAPSPLDIQNHPPLMKDLKEDNCLSRTNSIRQFSERTFPRSTKSEKLYPSMLERTEEGRTEFAARQRTHPSSIRGCAAPRLSMSPYSAFLGKTLVKDEVSGSSLSLVSTASSLYSTTEEKSGAEVRRLKRELQENHDRIHTLTSQLSTNAHVVAAFEQSLANMTHRLQNLTLTAEQKDSELAELRRTVHLLRKETISHLSTGEGNVMGRQLSADSVSSINSIASACSSHSHASSPSNLPPLSQTTPTDSKKYPKGKGWLRSSFSKAFSRSKGGKNGSMEKAEELPIEDQRKDRPSSSPYSEEAEKSLEELQRALREKDMALTDIRLEALTSAHQLESLKDTVQTMRSEMSSLKAENERLQRLLRTRTSMATEENQERNQRLETNQPITHKSSTPITNDCLVESQS